MATPIIITPPPPPPTKPQRAPEPAKKDKPKKK